MAKKRTIKDGPRSKSADDARNTGARDDWLVQLSDRMSLWFEDLGFPLPDFDIKSGFPSAGRRSSRISESWIDDKSGTYVVFIRPDRNIAMDIAAAIALQMCQIAVDKKDTHGHLFRHLSISIGLKGRRTESAPGMLFKELIQPILDAVGELPISEFSQSDGQKPKTQRSRLLKVSCPKCGYVARVSRKWLEEVGPPHCPEHGAMVAEI